MDANSGGPADFCADTGFANVRFDLQEIPLPNSVEQKQKKQGQEEPAQEEPAPRSFGDLLKTFAGHHVDIYTSGELRVSADSLALFRSVTEEHVYDCESTCYASSFDFEKVVRSR